MPFRRLPTTDGTADGKRSGPRDGGPLHRTSSEIDSMDHSTGGDARQWFEKSRAAFPLLAGLPACAYAVFYCVLGHIGKDAHNTWAMSYTDLTKETGLARRSIIRGVSALRRCGLLTTTQHKRERTTFTLHIPQLVTETTPVADLTGDRSDTNTSDRVGTSLVTVHEAPPSTSQHETSTLAAREKLKEVWARESPSMYPGVRNWEAFITSKIRAGEMPENKPSPYHGLRVITAGSTDHHESLMDRAIRNGGVRIY